MANNRQSGSRKISTERGVDPAKQYWKSLNRATAVFKRIMEGLYSNLEQAALPEKYQLRPVHYKVSSQNKTYHFRGLCNSEQDDALSQYDDFRNFFITLTSEHAKIKNLLRAMFEVVPARKKAPHNVSCCITQDGVKACQTYTSITDCNTLPYDTCNPIAYP
jgi:hypothetical protein